MAGAKQEEDVGRFSIVLPYPIVFDGPYSCALEEYYVEVERENPDKCLDIIIEMSSIVAGTIVNGAVMAALTMVSMPPGIHMLSEWKAGTLTFRPVVCSSLE